MFGERLHEAMLAAGIEIPGPVARACGVRSVDVLGWLVMEEADLPATAAYKLARFLDVRFGWLIEGEGEPPFNADAAEAVRIMNRLSPPQIRRWLASGRRMAGITP